MLCLSLADRMKQPLEGIVNLPIDTVYQWAAYFMLVDEQKDKK